MKRYYPLIVSLLLLAVFVNCQRNEVTAPPTEKKAELIYLRFGFFFNEAYENWMITGKIKNIGTAHAQHIKIEVFIEDTLGDTVRKRDHQIYALAPGDSTHYLLIGTMQNDYAHWRMQKIIWTDEID